MILIGSNVVYKATLTGLRISTAAGAALIDNAGATVPTLADGNHLIEIYDASGRMIKGYLKAAGDGEDVTSLLTNGDFETAGAGDPDIFANWTESKSGTSVIVDDTVAVHGGGHACRFDVDASNSYVAVKQYTPTVGTLYKVNYWIRTSSASISGKVSIGGAYTGSHAPGTTWTEYTEYATAISTDQMALERSNAASGSIWFDDVVSYRATGPSTSGCTISSTKGGTAMDDWTYKNASFTYNAASYYVVVKAVR